MTRPTEVTPRIFHLERGACIYILKLADNELAVIDTGFPGATAKIRAAVEALGFQATDVKHILITHADIDHVGSLAGLKELTGATVYAGDMSAGYIESVTSPPHLPVFASPILGLMQKLMQKEVMVDHRLEDGEQLPIGGGIEALHIPGHTPDNFGFWWPSEQAFFAADLIIRFDKLAITRPRITWNMDEAVRSARKLFTYDPAVIGPGHGAPVVVAQETAEVEALKKELL